MAICGEPNQGRRYPTAFRPSRLAFSWPCSPLPKRRKPYSPIKSQYDAPPSRMDCALPSFSPIMASMPFLSPRTRAKMWNDFFVRLDSAVEIIPSPHPVDGDGVRLLQQYVLICLFKE